MEIVSISVEILCYLSSYFSIGKEFPFELSCYLWKWGVNTEKEEEEGGD